MSMIIPTQSTLANYTAQQTARENTDRTPLFVRLIKDKRAASSEQLSKVDIVHGHIKADAHLSARWRSARCIVVFIARRNDFGGIPTQSRL